MSITCSMFIEHIFHLLRVSSIVWRIFWASEHLHWTLGRDDFNFLSWIVSASSYIVSVTERNSLDSMVLVRVVPHTQHKRYPCDRNFSKEWKNRFLVSCSVNLNRCLPYSLNPPQLPRETLWMGCVRSGIWPTPPTSAHIVTEKDSHWEKTIHMVRRGS